MKTSGKNLTQAIMMEQKEEKYIYQLEMKVRDYECDLQGIVNNANYQHYLEHTRHEFLSATGASFSELHNQGIDPVVARINMFHRVMPALPLLF